VSAAPAGRRAGKAPARAAGSGRKKAADLDPDAKDNDNGDNDRGPPADNPTRSSIAAGKNGQDKTTSAPPSHPALYPKRDDEGDARGLSAPSNEAAQLNTNALQKRRGRGRATFADSDNDIVDPQPKSFALPPGILPDSNNNDDDPSPVPDLPADTAAPGEPDVSRRQATPSVRPPDPRITTQREFARAIESCATFRSDLQKDNPPPQTRRADVAWEYNACMC